MRDFLSLKSWLCMLVEGEDCENYRANWLCTKGLSICHFHCSQVIRTSNLLERGWPHCSWMAPPFKDLVKGVSLNTQHTEKYMQANRIAPECTSARTCTHTTHIHTHTPHIHTHTPHTHTHIYTHTHTHIHIQSHMTCTNSWFLSWIIIPIMNLLTTIWIHICPRSNYLVKMQQLVPVKVKTSGWSLFQF
jgi:hypothetical protein